MGSSTHAPTASRSIANLRVPDRLAASDQASSRVITDSILGLIGGFGLREADRLLAEGKQIPEVAKHLEISEQTYHRWRKQYGGLKANDAKRLKELSNENTRLKRIVADKELEIDALREVAKGNF